MQAFVFVHLALIGNVDRKLKTSIAPKIMFFFVVVLSVTSLLWSFLPELIRWQLSTQLEKRGFELKVFESLALNDWQLELDQLEIGSESLAVKVKGLHLSMFGEYRVEIAQLDLNIDSTADGEVVQRDVLLANLRQLSAQLPLDIRINKLEVCEIQCLNFSLDLKKGLTAQKIQLEHEGAFILGLLSKDALSLEVYMMTPVLTAIQAEIDFTDSQKIRFTLKGNFENRDAPAFTGSVEDLEYTVLLKNLDLDFEGEIPGFGPVSMASVMRDAELIGAVNGIADWQATYQDFTLNGEFKPKTLFDFSLSKGVKEVRILNGLGLTMEHASLDATSIKLLEAIHCIHEIDLFCETASAVIQSRKKDIRLRTNVVHPNFRIQNEDWVFNTGLDVALFKAKDAVATFKTDFIRLDKQHLTLKQGRVSVLGFENIRVNLNHNVGSTKGSLRVEIENEMDRLSGVADYFAIRDLEIMNGVLKLDSEIAWASLEITHLDLVFSMKEFDASFQGYTLRGGDLSTTLSGWPLIVSDNISLFRAEALDIGVVMNSVALGFHPVFDMTNNYFKVEGRNFQGSLFGGDIQSDSYFLSYDNEVLDGHLALSINKVSLSDVLALEREDIEGSGYISGSVPVQLKNGKLSIENGIMAALDPGGVIKYNPVPSVVASIKGNSSLELITRVMSDFRYDSLDIGLNYSPEGIMIAKTSLKGSNPGFENGREVYFNLNLEENILTLLKSLRLGNDLAENLKLKGER